MTRQQWFFVALFLLILVFNVLAQVRQRRMTRPHEEPTREPAAPSPPAARPPLVGRPVPRSGRRRDTIPAPPTPELARIGRGARARLSARDLRRAVMLSAVLAPCHGVQPAGQGPRELRPAAERDRDAVHGSL